MGHAYKHTIYRLWRRAPAWRFSVIAALLFSLLAFMQTGRRPDARLGSSAGRPPTVAPRSLDPLSEARWTAYERAHAATPSGGSPGARCEALAAALAQLTADDLRTGRSPVFASKERLSALADGERCHDTLAQSEQRFTVLQQAVATAETRPEPETLQAVATALAALDDFDGSRGRFARETALLGKGQAMAEKLASSEAHLHELRQASALFATKRSGAVYIRLSEALKQLTDFDRQRLSREQPGVLETAQQALATLSESRTRLAQLFPLLSALQTRQTPQLQQQLVDATMAITPFDEEVATAEQQDALRRAREAAQPFAWDLLGQRLQALAGDATPHNVQAVAALYRLLKDRQGDELSESQRALLHQGQEAAATLAASEARLTALLTAAGWRQAQERPTRRILPVLQAVTAFDRARFQAPHTLAWHKLAAEEAMLRGPELGLTPDTKARVPLYIFSSTAGDLPRKIVHTWQETLRTAGFLLVGHEKEAALRADLTLLDAGDPQVDYSGPIVGQVSQVRLTLKMTWAADDSLFWTDQVEALARGAQGETLRNQALLQAINILQKHLQQKIEAR